MLPYETERRNRKQKFIFKTLITFLWTVQWKFTLFAPYLYKSHYILKVWFSISHENFFPATFFFQFSVHRKFCRHFLCSVTKSYSGYVNLNYSIRWFSEWCQSKRLQLSHLQRHVRQRAAWQAEQWPWRQSPVPWHTSKELHAKTWWNYRFGLQKRSTRKSGLHKRQSFRSYKRHDSGPGQWTWQQHAFCYCLGHFLREAMGRWAKVQKAQWKRVDWL